MRYLPVFAIVLLSIIILSYGTANAKTCYFEEWQEFLVQKQAEIAREPDNLIPHVQATIALINLDKTEKAIEEFSDISDYLTHDDLKKCLQLINLALQDSPYCYICLNQKAFLLFLLQDFGEALLYFENCIKHDYGNIWLHNFKALSYLGQINYIKAKETLQTSLSIKNNGYTHAFLGFLYWSEGSYTRAWWHFIRTGRLYFQIRSILR